MPFTVGCRCNKKYRDMSDRDVVASGVESSDTGLLCSQGQKAGKDTFRTTSAVVHLNEVLSAVFDLGAHCWREANQNVATFL